MKEITKQLQDEAISLTDESGQASFIYTIPESSDPSLLRVDIWRDITKERANVVASYYFDGFGNPCWEYNHKEYALQRS